MERGRFIVGTPIHFGVLNGHRKLVNGQHTLHAIARSGIPIRLTVLATPVEDEDELGQLYGRHDRGRGRTPSDAFLGMNLAGKLDLSTFEVNALGPAIKYVTTEFRNVRKNSNEEVATSLDFLAERMNEWSVFAGLYFEQVREGGVGLKGAFRRAPVVAVGVITMRYQRERAIDFWSAAAANDGLHKLDPRQALVNFLLKDSSRKGNPTHYARSVASAWKPVV